MEQELIEAFRKLKKRDVDTFPAIVRSVDKATGTCTIAVDELELSDVQLSSIIDGSNKKFYLFPAVNSSVLVSPINEDLHRLYIEAYSEIESLHLKINETEFKVSESGFLLKKENETLKGLISDLLTAVEQMSFTVTTTGGNGTTSALVNVVQFTSIKNRFNQFLNDV